MMGRATDQVVAVQAFKNSIMFKGTLDSTRPYTTAILHMTSWGAQDIARHVPADSTVSLCLIKPQPVVKLVHRLRVIADTRRQ